MKSDFFIVHDERALLGRFTRRADADRLALELGSGVQVCAEAGLDNPHLLARLVHWIDIDKRGRAKFL